MSAEFVNSGLSRLDDIEREFSNFIKEIKAEVAQENFADLFEVKKFINQRLDIVAARVRSKKFNDVHLCSALKDISDSTSNCGREAIDRAKTGPLVFLCDECNRQRVEDWENYHEFNWEAWYKCQTETDKDFWREVAAREHLNRLKYQRKYGYWCDKGHKDYEDSLEAVYQSYWTVSTYTWAIVKIEDEDENYD